MAVGSCVRRDDGVDCVSVQEAQAEGVPHDLCHRGLVLSVGE